MGVRRIYVEKKPAYAVEAKQLLWEIRHILSIKSISGLRLLNRYDVEGVGEELYRRCLPIVFYEPQLDMHSKILPQYADAVFAVEYLPGQYDQRAASCEECIQLVGQCERPTVRTARVYLFTGAPTHEEMKRIKKYVINPVETREADLSEKTNLRQPCEAPEAIETLHGFTAMDKEAVDAFVKKYNLAMDNDDLAFCRDYFLSEKRDPTLTEIRMIDTYWSDHCRHTTFLTALDSAEIHKPEVEKAFKRYLAARSEVYAGSEKPVTLMDIATMGAKALKKAGYLKNLDESEEVNACSIKLEVDVDGKTEPWLLMFKNETHNHPTEIEPFGGAATCIGGAIRDPLSGRTYVYQAMRVTGAANPLSPVAETLPGKLPQRKLVTTAAAGYSSYGNQIGLATGLVDEIYHPGYTAKRLEIGAVIGAAPEANVRRERPAPGDKIVLLGGRTGRDGCGGATGSSKAHKLESIETCGAEVQKGNAPTERKLQRLFRNGDATRMIKRCNDFGAGGVSVAIGELADGLDINLDLVPRKYDGLDGTELAISESQERMAVLLAPEDTERFLATAHEENLEATVVAEVTEEARLRMHWKGQVIVDLSRAFLNSNGAKKHARVQVPNDTLRSVGYPGRTFCQQMERMVSDLNICSKKGLSERFDSTIGAATVLMPFGGARQLAPSQVMVAKLPLLRGTTDTVTGMAWGFHPQVMEQSPYEGAYLAVIESVAKLVAAGFDYHQAYLTFQEYFERMSEDPERWGQPFSALLGAFDAQMDLKLAAIGGKDSMSGSFEKMDVPPTLVSFAVAPGKIQNIISTACKSAGHTLRLITCDPHDTEALMHAWDAALACMREGKVLSAWALGLGGVSEGLFKMALGNHLGIRMLDSYTADPFEWHFGSLLLECTEDCTIGEPVAQTTEAYTFVRGSESLDMDTLQEMYEDRLDNVFGYRGHAGETTEAFTFTAEKRLAPAVKKAKPLAFIPVFPGTNCEYDTLRALERAGGAGKILVLNNLTPQAITDSLEKAREMLDRSQMLILPGGFSGGDEPDGSAKFITAFFRNPMMMDAVSDLLERREGLILGICNGFQALIKLGLVPFGKIVDTDASCPALTFNEIGRHQSMLVRTRIASNKSPWMRRMDPGEIFTVAVSHGEGRFVGSETLIRGMAENGQIAAQYVDLKGCPSMDMRYNPNGSFFAIEAIASPDGRILGKMGHSERSGEGLYLNVPGNKLQPLFEGGVDYFR